MQHDHVKFVEGCFRCDLSRDEVMALGYAEQAEDDLKMAEEFFPVCLETWPEY